jgi:hypothetical protein
MSILGHNPGPFYQEGEAVQKFMDKVMSELGI